jgi:hypothetical protein
MHVRLRNLVSRILFVYIAGIPHYIYVVCVHYYIRFLHNM